MRRESECSTEWRAGLKTLYQHFKLHIVNDPKDHSVQDLSFCHLVRNNSMERSRFWEANKQFLSLLVNTPHFMKPEGSLPCSQQTANFLLFVCTSSGLFSFVQVMYWSLLERSLAKQTNLHYALPFCFLKPHFNLLKPTGYVMHQQFDIQQPYVLPTLYLCVLYLSENKRPLVPLTA